MLEAKKSLIFEKIFAIYNKNLLKRRFNSLCVSGLEIFENSTLPCLIYANHSSWWDGLTAFQVSHFLHFDSFIMMEEKQLKNLQFFRRLGAFSIIRENRREALESVNYAIKLLKVNSRKTLWIFPQGEILPNNVRPLRFFNGLAHIVKKVEVCAVVPLALRYEFLGNFKPEIFVKVGQPIFFSAKIKADKADLTDNFAKVLANSLDELKKDVIENKLDKYQNII